MPGGIVAFILKLSPLRSLRLRAVDNGGDLLQVMRDNKTQRQKR